MYQFDDRLNSATSQQKAVTALWSVTVAKQRRFCNYNRTRHFFFLSWLMLYLSGSGVHYKMQHVKRSTMFPHGVNITPGKEDQTGRPWRGIFIRWWAVNQLLLEAQGGRNQKEWWSSTCPLITPPNPQPPTPIACNLFHSPQSVDLFPPLSYLPAQPVSHAHTLVSFQYLYLRFLSTPFLHLSPHQPNFLSSSSTFSHHPCLPHPLFSPPAGAIPRERKRRSALSQHRFTFLSHSVTPARMQDWWFGGFPLTQRVALYRANAIYQEQNGKDSYR